MLICKLIIGLNKKCENPNKLTLLIFEKKNEIGNTSSNDQVCSQENMSQLTRRDDEINNIKGVKLKGKVRGKSTRPKSALEKATKKKKHLETQIINYVNNLEKYQKIKKKC